MKRQKPQPEQVIRIAGLCRVSSDDGGPSLDDQEKWICNYVKDDNRRRLVKMIKEKNVSGGL